MTSSVRSLFSNPRKQPLGQDIKNIYLKQCINIDQPGTETAYHHS